LAVFFSERDLARAGEVRPEAFFFLGMTR
jgi:hypothetical protein